MCVVSAVIGVSVILATVIGELILYYQKSELLTIWSWTITTSNLTDIIPTTSTTSANETVINEIDSISSAIFNESFFVTLNETTVLPEPDSNVTDATFQVAHEFIRSTGINLHVTIFLAFISIIGILSAITVGLLLHLCFFHVYISFLGLTTYEYIRNQRQLENQNSLKKSIAKSTSIQINTNDTLSPPNKSTHANQLYFCSHVDPKNLVESHGTAATTAAHRPKSIHCCDTTMQYENSTHKAFYICSVLHDRPSPILVPSSMAHELTLNSSRTSRSKTFHCCSEYKHIVKLSEASSQAGGYNSGEETAPPTELSSAASTTTDGEYVKLIEQCTFCSFKLKSKKKSKVGASEANGSHAYNYREDVDLKMTRKRNWVCCSSNGPKSTDSDISDGPQIDTISASIDPKANRNHINQRLKFSYDEHQLNSNNGAKPMSQIAKLPAANGMIAKPRSRASLSTNLKSNGSGGGCSSSGSGSGKRTRAKRKAWPTRLQHMLRMFGRCQQPHSLNNSHPHVNNANHSRQLPPSPRRSIKQNQIRPMDTLEQQCEELKQQRRQQMQQLHDTINMPTHAAHADQTDCESMENDEIVPIQKMTHQPPAPPPPVRRKINNATADIQELAESLSFVQNPSHHHHHNPSRANKHKEQIQKTQPPRPLLMVNRKRRKNIFRSPNLSPIHETGYSNPTSPKPYRHSISRTAPTTPQLSSDSSTSTPKFAHQY